MNPALARVYMFILRFKYFVYSTGTYNLLGAEVEVGVTLSFAEQSFFFAELISDK